MFKVKFFQVFKNQKKKYEFSFMLISVYLRLAFSKCYRQFVQCRLKKNTTLK